ncbi:MAG TPA: spore coat U domain-containing protein [Ramlibacter sp.]
MNRAWLLALLLVASAANATPFCRIVSAGGLAFGGYDPYAANPTDTSVTLRITCDGTGRVETATLDIALSPGVSGSSHGRKMIRLGSADSLQYNLFRDSARTSSWGMTPGLDTVSRTLTVPARGTVSTVVTVYARLPPLQDVSIGTYFDSVQLTISP